MRIHQRLGQLVEVMATKELDAHCEFGQLGETLQATTWYHIELLLPVFVTRLFQALKIGYVIYQYSSKELEVVLRPGRVVTTIISPTDPKLLELLEQGDKSED
jgi:hypothetical protein